MRDHEHRQQVISGQVQKIQKYSRSNAKDRPAKLCAPDSDRGDCRGILHEIEFGFSTNVMARIFVRHSSENRDQAKRLADWLQSHGVDSILLDFSATKSIAARAHWERALNREISTLPLASHRRAGTSISIPPPLVPAKCVLKVHKLALFPRHKIHADHVETRLRCGRAGQLAHIPAG